jgi:hypothetical protein
LAHYPTRNRIVAQAIENMAFDDHRWSIA